MRKVFFAFLGIICLFMVSCSSSSEKKPNTETEKSVVPQASAAAAFNIAIDSLAPEQKEIELKNASFSSAEWRDTYCPACSRRCCSPCTAGGNPSQCAETRFRECGQCGHTSSNHYSVKH